MRFLGNPGKKTAWALLALLAGCSATPARYGDTARSINDELGQAAAQQKKAAPAQPDAVSSALLPALKIELPKAGKLLEQKFDLVVNNASASQVFMGIVSGTRYSMLVHPEVTGALSVNLKDVTVMEALEAIRELYGYDYRVAGTQIFIQPLTLQTRIFHVNYLSAQRKGTSDLRVLSGAVTDSVSGSGGGAAAQGGGATSVSALANRITTTTNSEFWEDLTAALKAVVGTEPGRSVVVSPQSGVIVVRAMPAELKNLVSYLQLSQLVIDRQVMLEAKIIEVELTDRYQSGINWASFQNSGSRHLSVGQVTPFTFLRPSGSISTGSDTLFSTPGTDLTTGAGALGGLFGLAFQTGNFAALLTFLETQGKVHVLSSPRIATVNNQQAVLKVGTDEFFVVGVKNTVTSIGSNTIVTPEFQTQPFFSGISLNVTPQIDENNNVVLHIHPSVSTVSTVSKGINYGSSGTFSLPLASSKVSETDSIVRAANGNIIAIGGLMSQSSNDDRSQIPGLGDLPGIGSIFRQTDKTTSKRELVILLKPTVVQADTNWSADILEARERIRRMERSVESEK
jgi:MSHA biogenesis protein MshL